MGENLAVDGRLAVRTPMQWSAARNGGFSPAAPSRLPRPLPTDGYSPEHVNAVDQRHDPDSLLSFMSLLIRRYRQSPELGWAEFKVLEQPEKSVLAHLAEWDDGSMVAVHNFGANSVKIPLQLEGCDDGHSLVDLLDHGTARLDQKGRATIALEGYGYRWLRVVSDESRRLH